MRIIVSQQDLPAQAGKKLIAEFRCSKSVDKYLFDKAEDFLVAIDKFIKKRKIRVESLQKADLGFVDTSILTERVIRAIMLGLSFFHC